MHSDTLLTDFRNSRVIVATSDALIPTTEQLYPVNLFNNVSFRDVEIASPVCMSTQYVDSALLSTTHILLLFKAPSVQNYGRHHATLTWPSPGTCQMSNGINPMWESFRRRSFVRFLHDWEIDCKDSESPMNPKENSRTFVGNIHRSHIRKSKAGIVAVIDHIIITITIIC